MPARYAAVRATVTQYTLPVPIPKNKSSSYGNDSDEDSDGPPPSPKKTDATEMKIDKSLQVFIEALSHLEPLHYGFKPQASNEKGYFICSLVKCLTPWRRKHNIVVDHSMCGIRPLQGSSIIQHCGGKGDEYHKATAFYLTTLFQKRNRIDTGYCSSWENDQSRKTVDANKQLSGRYYQSIDSQESQTISTK
jgi:hypothetical protein